MIVAAVMDELAGRLALIPGLRTYGWPVGSVAPPAAVVGYPTEYDYDGTYGRGMDTMTIPVVVVVGRATDRTARDDLSAYLSGAGPHSVKAALESGPGVAYDVLRVARADFDIYTVGSVDHVAAIFDVEIAGPGER